MTRDSDLDLELALGEVARLSEENDRLAAQKAAIRALLREVVSLIDDEQWTGRALELIRAARRGAP